MHMNRFLSIRIVPGSVLSVLILMLVLVTPMRAQSIAGSISGTVVDERHGAVHVAAVVARNVETNILRSTQTDEAGNYRFAELPVGVYEVRVQASGFATLVRTGITVALNREA